MDIEKRKGGLQVVHTTSVQLYQYSFQILSVSNSEKEFIILNTPQLCCVGAPPLFDLYIR
jgi:hypothetical protein